jgi:hypothetical protein
MSRVIVDLFGQFRFALTTEPHANGWAAPG